MRKIERQAKEELQEITTIEESVNLVVERLKEKADSEQVA